MKHEFDFFPIGATVFVPSAKSEEVDTACPDCMGQKKWFIHIPGRDESRVIDCPRCGGGEKQYLVSKRHKITPDVTEVVIMGYEIETKQKWNSEEYETRIKYTCQPHRYSLNHDECFETREAAEEAAQRLMDEKTEKEEESYRKERERQEREAGHDIIRVFRDQAFARTRALEEKIDDLKTAMMEAIQHPSIDGPKVDRYGSITSSNMAEWFSEMLDKAGIEGWSESEIHEATCHC